LREPADDARQRDRVVSFLRSLMRWENMAAQAGAAFPGDPALRMAEDILRYLGDAR